MGWARGDGILVEDSQVERIWPPIADGHGPPDCTLAGGFAMVGAFFAIWICHGAYPVGNDVCASEGLKARHLTLVVC